MGAAVYARILIYGSIYLFWSAPMLFLSVFCYTSKRYLEIAPQSLTVFTGVAVLTYCVFVFSEASYLADGKFLDPLSYFIPFFGITVFLIGFQIFWFEWAVVPAMRESPRLIRLFLEAGFSLTPGIDYMTTYKTMVAGALIWAFGVRRLFTVRPQHESNNYRRVGRGPHEWALSNYDDYDDEEE
jgi:hypothetical protein